MHFLITGAGKIGRQLLADLAREGHTVSVIRRSSEPLEGVKTVSADAGDFAAVHAAAQSAQAIFHCIHTSYSPGAWRRELPKREQVVMDVAADLGIPVIFPESVYAFGRSASLLSEGMPMRPCSPLGEVRAHLLRNRITHAATTVSMVASDLIGPTAQRSASVPTLSIIAPLRTRSHPWLLGKPNLPHSLTYIPDLTKAMIEAARRSAHSPGSVPNIVHAPVPETVSMQEFAKIAAHVVKQAEPAVPASTPQPSSPPKVLGLSSLPLALGGTINPTLRSLWQQRYLWHDPVIVLPGIAQRTWQLTPTPWEEMSFGEA